MRFKYPGLFAHLSSTHFDYTSDVVQTQGSLLLSPFVSWSSLVHGLFYPLKHIGNIIISLTQGLIAIGLFIPAVVVNPLTAFRYAINSVFNELCTIACSLLGIAISLSNCVSRLASTVLFGCCMSSPNRAFIQVADLALYSSFDDMLLLNEESVTELPEDKPVTGKP